MPSLNQIGSIFASRLNRPFDDQLKAEFKPLFINEISLLIRRSIDANGIDAMYIASFVVDLIKVDALDNIGTTGEHNILRSINRIPIPIRYKTPVPFIYVGSVDNELPFGYINSHEANFTKHLPYIGSAITYTYPNGYIYVRNNIKLDKLRVTAPYASFNLITDNVTGSNGIPYDDDMELPYPEDLINTCILNLLQGIFGGIDTKDKVEATHLDNQ